MTRPSPDGRRMAETENTGSGRKPDQQVPGSKGSPMTEHPTDAMIERIDARISEHRTHLKKMQEEYGRGNIPDERTVGICLNFGDLIDLREAAKPSTPIDDEGLEAGNGLEMQADQNLVELSRSFTEDFSYDIGMVRGVMRQLADRLEAIASLPTPVIEEGLVERMTVWLYAREGGVAFEQLPEAEQEHWRKQGRDAVRAVGLAAIDDEGLDFEDHAWKWLDAYSQQRHGEVPADVEFSADQMVDAFIAGIESNVS